MDKVFVLTETYEDKTAIREFNVIGIYEKLEDAKKKMKKLIKLDEYGFIKDKGICENEETFFQTNFDGGFLEYSIFPKPIIEANPEPKKKVWPVRVYWEMSGSVNVEAETLEEAVEYAYKHINKYPLPENGYYIEDSFEIDMHQCE